MAQKYQFVQGVFSNEFLQLKTTDNIYLKELLEGVLFPSLEMYNASVGALSSLVAFSYDDSVANLKKLFGDNSFTEIGDLEVPPAKSTLDSWNSPQPLRRLGAANKMTLEVIKQMSSSQIIGYQDSVYLADRKQLIKIFFQNMLTKAPAGRVDCLTNVDANPFAFWNDESSMDTPRPNGQITFDGDHDHYILTDVSGTTDADDLSELMGLVSEHEGMGGAQLILWFRKNSAELTAVKALTGYRPVEAVAPILGSANPSYDSTGLVQALINSKRVLGDTAAIVGTYKEALVVETPDMPQYYCLCTAYMGDNSPAAPLGWREHPQFKGLMMVNPTGENPIIGHNAQFRRYMSGYVNNRSAGAAMLCTHSAAWAEPSFT